MYLTTAMATFYYSSRLALGKHSLLPPHPLGRRGCQHQEEGHVACTCHKGHAPHHPKAQAANAAKKTAAGRESTKMPECQQSEGRHHQAVLCCHIERTPRAHRAVLTKMWKQHGVCSMGPSIKESEVMHQLAPGKQYLEPNISMKGQGLNAVDKFTYFDKTLTPTVVIDVEVNTRLAKASVAFSRLCKNVWDRRSIATETKIKVYQAVLLTTLLYGCESWTLYQRHARKLKHFYITSLRTLLSLKWQDKILNGKVLT